MNFEMQSSCLYLDLDLLRIAFQWSMVDIQCHFSSFSFFFQFFSRSMSYFTDCNGSSFVPSFEAIFRPIGLIESILWNWHRRIKSNKSTALQLKHSDQPIGSKLDFQPRNQNSLLFLSAATVAMIGNADGCYANDMQMRATLMIGSVGRFGHISLVGVVQRLAFIRRRR